MKSNLVEHANLMRKRVKQWPQWKRSTFVIPPPDENKVGEGMSNDIIWQVSRVRKGTGASLLVCKQAVHQCRGFVDLAIEWVMQRNNPLKQKEIEQVAEERMNTEMTIEYQPHGPQLARIGEGIYVTTPLRSAFGTLPLGTIFRSQDEDEKIFYKIGKGRAICLKVVHATTHTVTVPSHDFDADTLVSPLEVSYL